MPDVEQSAGQEDQREDRGLVSRIGPVLIDWPKSIGYFGGISLAVAAGVIEPPLGIFIAAIPFLKLLKRPDAPLPLRAVVSLVEGAAKPVGGDAESTIRPSSEEGQTAGAGGPQRTSPATRNRRPRSSPRATATNRTAPAVPRPAPA